MPPPKFITDFMSNFLTAGIKGAIGEHLEENGTPCGIKGCKHFAVGLYCNDCSRALCGNHLYFKPSLKQLKPNVMCPSCIVDLHEELFE